MDRLDREIDLISPLVSPLTYEGLVDEILGIEFCRTKVDASLFNSDDGNETMLAGKLNADSQLVLGN